MSAEVADTPIESFANHVLMDWDSAMDRFFTSVNRKRVARGITSLEVHDALALGYGIEIADAWGEWFGLGDDS